MNFSKTPVDGNPIEDKLVQSCGGGDQLWRFPPSCGQEAWSHLKGNSNIVSRSQPDISYMIPDTRKSRGWAIMSDLELPQVLLVTVEI